MIEDKDMRTDKVVAGLRLIEKLQEALNDVSWSIEHIGELEFLVVELRIQCENLLFNLRGHR
jgi:hypothetical protein